MSNENTGTSLLMVIQLVLLGIKINGVGTIAALSWGWILLPLWIWIALAVFLFIVYLAIK